MKSRTPPRSLPVPRLAAVEEIGLRHKIGQATLTDIADAYSSLREPYDLNLRLPSIHPLARAGGERADSVHASPVSARPWPRLRGASAARGRALKERRAPMTRGCSSNLSDLSLSLRNTSMSSDSVSFSMFITLNSDVPIQALARMRWAWFGSW